MRREEKATPVVLWKPIEREVRNDEGEVETVASLISCHSFRKIDFILLRIETTAAGLYQPQKRPRTIMPSPIEGGGKIGNAHLKWATRSQLSAS